jgi:hypothetical protein
LRPIGPPGVNLAGLPLVVADHGLGAPAVRAADAGGGAGDGLDLYLGPRVEVVAHVDALEAVEMAVSVGVGLVVGRHLLLVDDGLENVIVAAAGVVGAAVPDQMYGAVLGDHAVTQRAGQAAVSVAAQGDAVRRAGGHGVVNHHAVHGAPWPLVVAVVMGPVADFDDGHALAADCVAELRSRQGVCHVACLQP